MQEFITLTVEEYDKLMRDSEFLCALEEAGVHNWDGYDHAYNIFRYGDNL